MAEVVTAALVETFIAACVKKEVPHDADKMRADFGRFLAYATGTVDRRGGRGKWVESN